MSKRWLWWAKRDLRVQDNDALCHITENDHEALTLFVFEPSLGAAPETSAFHALAQREAVQNLQASLTARGGDMVIATGEVIDVLEALYQCAPFDGLVSHEETGSDITFTRDKSVARWANQKGITWLELPQNGVIRGPHSRDNRQEIIAERLWNAPMKKPPRKIQRWSSTLPKPSTAQSHSTVHWHHFVPDESALTEWASPNTYPLTPASHEGFHTGRQGVTEDNARRELTSFFDQRGFAYSGGISSPNKAFTAGSRLSTHLAWGTLSLRQAFHENGNRAWALRQDKSPDTQQWMRSLNAFQSRLHWHDHFMQRLESAPEMEFSALNPAYEHLQYETDPDIVQQRLLAWRTGQTGIPMIDACIRCLMTTGFLNFRMRAMLVTTACFGLQIHWRELIHPLAQLFADYEPGIHLSQIQMQAGVVGINTLRVYSPHKQLLDHDPTASFIKRWIPELREFSALDIANYEFQPLGDYPTPITNITSNAKVIKDRLFAIRGSDTGKDAARTTLELHGSRLSRNDRGANRNRLRKKRSKREQDKSGSDSQMSFDW